MMYRLTDFKDVTMLFNDFYTDTVVGLNFYIKGRRVNRCELEDATKMKFDALISAMVNGEVKMEKM